MDEPEPEHDVRVRSRHARQDVHRDTEREHGVKCGILSFIVMNVRTEPTRPDGSPLEDAHAVHRINASWLVRLRWAAILGQAVVVAQVEWGLGISLPLPPLCAILAVELLAN